MRVTVYDDSLGRSHEHPAEAPTDLRPPGNHDLTTYASHTCITILSWLVFFIDSFKFLYSFHSVKVPADQETMIY